MAILNSKLVVAGLFLLLGVDSNGQVSVGIKGGLNLNFLKVVYSKPTGSGSSVPPIRRPRVPVSMLDFS